VSRHLQRNAFRDGGAVHQRVHDYERNEPPKPQKTMRTTRRATSYKLS
jgi:hypothetical protein